MVIGIDRVKLLLGHQRQLPGKDLEHDHFQRQRPHGRRDLQVVALVAGVVCRLVLQVVDEKVAVVPGVVKHKTRVKGDPGLDELEQVQHQAALQADKDRQLVFTDERDVATDRRMALGEIRLAQAHVKLHVQGEAPLERDAQLARVLRLDDDRNRQLHAHGQHDCRQRDRELHAVGFRLDGQAFHVHEHLGIDGVMVPPDRLVPVDIHVEPEDQVALGLRLQVGGGALHAELLGIVFVGRSPGAEMNMQILDVPVVFLPDFPGDLFLFVAGTLQLKGGKRQAVRVAALQPAGPDPRGDDRNGFPRRAGNHVGLLQLDDHDPVVRFRLMQAGLSAAVEEFIAVQAHGQVAAAGIGTPDPVLAVLFGQHDHVPGHRDVPGVLPVQHHPDLVVVRRRAGAEKNSAYDNAQAEEQPFFHEGISPRFYYIQCAQQTEYTIDRNRL